MVVFDEEKNVIEKTTTFFVIPDMCTFFLIPDMCTLLCKKYTYLELKSTHIWSYLFLFLTPLNE